MILAVADPMTLVMIAVLVASCALAINYVCEVRSWHQGNVDPRMQQIPPKHPSCIPYLGNSLQLLWDTRSLLQRATCFAGRLTSSRITVFPLFDVYLFQDRETIKEIWKKSAAMCAGKVHVLACKYMFGMSGRTLALYAADNSGPFPKPFPGSHVLPENRIHRILNNGIDKALTGPGFDPKLQRFRRSLISQIQHLDATDQGWIEIRNFHEFMHHTVGLSIVKAIFGPNLVRLNPTFMDDLFEFEHWFPILAKGVPSFIAPKAYAVRRRLHSHFKRWYAYAREHYSESSIDPDGDADPFWGSEWMRQRQEALHKLQDEDSLAAGDLGVAWASLSNIVAASALMLIHVANNVELTKRVREDVVSRLSQGSLADIDLKGLSNSPIISSIYAETLRLHVQTFTVVSSPIENISLGKFWLPRGELGLVNSHLAHTDNEFWNTKEDSFPLDTFWAERFLIDPADPSSGPSKLGPGASHHESTNGAPYFSLKGLEGSWIPYGGGHLVCPGRFLAKNVMAFSTALLSKEFDIEVTTDKFDIGSRNYGFGISMPEKPIQIRMRRR